MSLRLYKLSARPRLATLAVVGVALVLVALAGAARAATPSTPTSTSASITSTASARSASSLSIPATSASEASRPQAPTSAATPASAPAPVASDGIVEVRAPAAADDLSIGTFARDDVEVTGCGCSFFPGDGSKGPTGPLLLRVAADGRAAMRLDGQLVALRKTSESVVRRNKKQLSTGDKLLMTLRGADASASVNAALERSCRVEDGCRQLTYRGVVGASRAGKRGAVPAWGVCSC